METTTILLLAGGASSRMGGRDKLLETVDGEPLIANRARMCVAAKAGQVLVVLPPDRPARDAALRGIDARRLHTSGSAYGMSHSLKLGLGTVDSQTAMIVLADMPGITTDDLLKLLTEARLTSAKVIRGSQGDRAGHPVLIDRSLFKALDSLSGDEGAAKVLSEYRDQTRLVKLPGDHATCDLDTEADWAAWRARTIL